MFSCQICETCKKTFFEEHLRMATSKETPSLTHLMPLISFDTSLVLPTQQI